MKSPVNRTSFILKLVLQLFLFFHAHAVSGQPVADIWHLSVQTDFIAIGVFENIDTVLIEYRNQQLKQKRASFFIDNIIKGESDQDRITVAYPTMDHHIIMAPTSPELGNKYYVFLKYDSTFQSYVTTFNTYSIVDHSTSSEAQVISIIEKLNQEPTLNECAYFDLLLENIDEPIAPVSASLSHIDLFGWDINKCLDSANKSLIYNAFKKNKNLHLIPFIDESKINQVDSILLQEVNKGINEMQESNSETDLENASKILNQLLTISYISRSISDKEASKLFAELFSLNTNDEMKEKLKDIYNKYCQYSPTH